MKLRLVRCCTGPDGTFSVLLKDGVPVCNMVERPWLDNHPQTSCIPAGTYEAVAYHSPTKGDVWLLKDVPGRNFIEIHSANFSVQLEGCLAPGQGFFTEDGKRGVSNSRVTMNDLKQVLPAEFTLEIINAF